MLIDGNTTTCINLTKYQATEMYANVSAVGKIVQLEVIMEQSDDKGCGDIQMLTEMSTIQNCTKNKRCILINRANATNQCLNTCDCDLDLCHFTFLGVNNIVNVCEIKIIF